MELMYENNHIKVYKTFINDESIELMGRYFPKSKLIHRSDLEDYKNEDFSIYLFLNQKDDIVGHSVIRDIYNDELILVYDFADISWYPLGDDSERHGTYISTLEVLPDYRHKGLAKEFIGYIKSTIKDKLILKSLKDSKVFWEKQGFEIIYDEVSGESAWMVLDNK